MHCLELAHEAQLHCEAYIAKVPLQFRPSATKILTFVLQWRMLIRKISIKPGKLERNGHS